MSFDPESAAQVELHRSLMTAFCNVLRSSRLPPMTVMSLAAAAMGAIYREVADEHLSGDACPCGWRPDPAIDIEVLQTALAAATGAAALPDLRTLQVLGRA